MHFRNVPETEGLADGVKLGSEDGSLLGCELG